MKFFIDNIFLIGTALLAGGALLWPSLQRRGSKVSLLQATQMINQGKTLLLDVRQAAEFAGGHLRDSRNISLAELPKKVSELDKFKAKPVIVICESGVRSSKATSILKNAGFAEVFSLDGGVAAWQAQGLPLQKS
ncbi:MAG: rhodanese-like domain-containing protein [Pseudomonadota bacterium]